MLRSSYRSVPPKSGFAPLADEPAFLSDPFGSPGRGLPVWKRILDICLILLTAPIWLPLLIFTVLVIKILSPGPVFFRQRRIGLSGREFMIYKFRSMKMNAETVSHEEYVAELMRSNAPMIKLDAKDDPRLIPGGRLLRATCLDELPQLFNVLKGDMSLVGPRPCTPTEFCQYTPWQQRRANAAPGLTGLWQVNGKNKTTFSEMIEWDLRYVEQLSPFLDLIIIIKTFPAIYVQVTESQARRREVRRSKQAPHPPRTEASNYCTHTTTSL